METLTLKQAYNKTLGSKGVFSYLLEYIFATRLEYSVIPWICIYPDEDFTLNLERAEMLDNLYFFQYSGMKPVSPLVFNMYDYDTESISEEELIYISGMFYQVYGQNLREMWNVLTAEYNPLENYNLTETVDEDTTASASTDYTGSQTDRNDYEHNQRKVPYDDSTAHLESVGDGYDETVRSFTNRNDSTSGSGTKDTTTVRHGNIGVTTTQTLVRSTMKLWERNFFFNYVFPYLDKILTLPIY